MKKTNIVNRLAACTLASTILLAQAAPAFAAQTHFHPTVTKVNTFAQPVDPGYQVKFNPQGGTLEYDHVDSDEYGNVVLPEEAPIKDGYIFLGWAVNPENGIVSYQPEDEITISNDLKLYAVWEQSQPVVNPQVMFNPQGGTLEYDHVDSDEYGNVVLPEEAPIKDGYIFLGWAVNPENGIVSYLPGDAFAISNDLKLYAVWEQSQPVVNPQVMFNPQGGTLSYDHVDSDEYGNVVLPAEAPIKDGYIFLGWAVNPENGIVSYLPGDAFTISNDLKLYAVWQQIQPVVNPQVMFNPQGGTLSYDHVDSDEFGNVVLPAEAPVKEGNKFLGWSTDPESGEVAYQPGDAFTISNDLKLYAVWQQVQPEIHVTLYFDANGGVGGPTSIASNADGSVTISTLIPVKNGYKFMGWATNAKADKAEYGINTTLKLTSDLKLYAVWQADSKVNTGVENYTSFYLFSAVAAIAVAAVVMGRKKRVR